MLTKLEKLYCATRKEMLALVWAVRHFRLYLLGQPYIVRTDHNSLKWLQSFKDAEGQVARWLEILSEYDMTVEHRPGRFHTNADALSRIPVHQEEPSLSVNVLSNYVFSYSNQELAGLPCNRVILISIKSFSG